MKRKTFAFVLVPVVYAMAYMYNIEHYIHSIRIAKYFL